MRVSIAILILTLYISCSESNHTSNNSYSIKIELIDFDKSSEMIDEEEYWKIIDKSYLEFNDYNKQKSAFISELLKLKPKEIIGFDLRTSKLLKDSYTSELWCAAYIMKGGCSDDGFDYFRCWLISKGKDVFYSAIKNPDSLIEIKKKFLFDYELEEFLYLPATAFNIKTNKEIYDHIDYDKFWKELGSKPQLVFNWNEDDSESMKKICPKLYEKY